MYHEYLACAVIPPLILGIIKICEHPVVVSGSEPKDIVIEGFNIGKEIGKAFKKPIDTIKKPIEDVKKKTEKTVDSLEKVVGSIAKIGAFLGAVFIAIGSYLECAVFYVKNIFSYCIVYYLLYITMVVIYAPFALLFWATSTQALENMIWNFAEMIHDFLKDLTGIDMLQYVVPDECYKCNIRPMPKLNL